MVDRPVISAVFLAGIVAALVGCGAPDDGAPLIPSPGTVVVMAVTPVDETLPGGLIPNGDFAEWYAGLSFPTGFSAPRNGASSIVARDRMWGHLGTTGFTARQTWFDYGVAETREEGFSTTVTLEANRPYVFEVVAATSPGMAAWVGAYTQREDGTLAPLVPTLVEVAGETPTRYTGHFETGAETTVVLRSQISPLADVPGVVTWSQWAIHPGGERASDTGSPIDAHRWAANSLDHVRSQIDLYGGVGPWSKDLYDLHKNLGRVYRESEATRGNGILGYDQYIFQKSELQYVTEVEDFLHRNEDSQVVYRPAFQALLRLDRALAARGTQLVVVPVPDRIHLYADQIHQRAAAGPPSYLAHTRLVEGLLNHGVLAVDVAPLLRHRRFTDNAVYWKTEYGVPSYTLAEIADYVAPLFHEVSGTAVTLTRSKESTPLAGKAVPGLDPTVQKSVTLKEHDLRHVILDQTGEVYKPVSESPILVVGSLATIYSDLGASFAAQLAYAGGKDTAVLPAPIGDQEVPAYLIENTTPALAKARVVVFCLPEYTLVRPGW